MTNLLIVSSSHLLALFEFVCEFFSTAVMTSNIGTENQSIDSILRVVAKSHSSHYKLKKYIEEQKIKWITFIHD